MKSRKTLPDFVPGILLATFSLFGLRVVFGLDVHWVVITAPVLAGIVALLGALVLHGMLVIGALVSSMGQAGLNRLDRWRENIRSRTPGARAQC